MKKWEKIFLGDMSEEEAEKYKEEMRKKTEEYRRIQPPKWTLLIPVAWLIVCAIAISKYPIMGKAWNVLIFLGIFLGGGLVMRHMFSKIEGRKRVEKQREEMGISKELD